MNTHTHTNPSSPSLALLACFGFDTTLSCVHATNTTRLRARTCAYASHRTHAWHHVQDKNHDGTPCVSGRCSGMCGWVRSCCERVTAHLDARLARLHPQDVETVAGSSGCCRTACFVAQTAAAHSATLHHEDRPTRVNGTPVWTLNLLGTMARHQRVAPRSAAFLRLAVRTLYHRVDGGVCQG